MIHNALQRFTELQRGAKVALGLDAGAGGLERMSETLQLVKDFWQYPEDAYLRGGRLCQGYRFVAAGGAGNFSAVAFAMQQDGWIATLKYVLIGCATAGGAYILRGLPLPNVSVDRVFRDMRITGSPVGRITYVNNVAAAPGGTGSSLVRFGASQTVIVPVDWVIVNGGPTATETACVVYHATANTAFEVGYIWEERQLLPGELAR